MQAHNRYRRYNRLLLLAAGLGGLLYGVDVGIIGGALPYLEATAALSAAQLSMVVAAVLFGSVMSTLFAGALADAFGRRSLMLVSGLAFVVSIPVIALSHGFGPLVLGRLLQGASGGFIGVVVPLYLAECLQANVRGKGTALFQWLLTLGIFTAALIAVYYSYRVQAIEHLADASTIFAFKDQAWRRIFWVSLPPGILFVVSSFFLAESPRWLLTKGREAAAAMALRRALPEEEAVREMEAIRRALQNSSAHSSAERIEVRDTLLSRRYVVPFLIACAVLFCNTATGMNSIIGYNTDILLRSGLSDFSAHWGYVLFTALNFLFTMVGVRLVDRKGRKFLLSVGTAGMLGALLFVSFLFRTGEHANVDCRSVIQSSVQSDQTLDLTVNQGELARLLAASSGAHPSIDAARASFQLIYSYGGYTSETPLYRSTDAAPLQVHIQRSNALPHSRVEGFLSSPFSNLPQAKTAPLVIERAVLAPLPSPAHGWLVATSLFVFVVFYAMGPGVCVWLALSELMPTRIRSNGMSIALVINQLVSTISAAVFLPVVSHFGYSTIFFLFAGFSLVYLLVVVFFVPETRGLTLEQIEGLFAGSRR